MTNAITIPCEICHTSVILPPVEDKPGHVSILPLQDWHYTTETGWLCRECNLSRTDIPKTEIQAYLDGAIKRWREIRESESPHRIMAEYYVDAYQAIRESLLGEVL